MKAAKQKTRLQYDTHTEHYLMPAALFLLNICTVHVIYAYANARTGQLGWLLLLTFAWIALGSAVWLKNRIYLGGSMALYLALLTYCWL